MQLSYLYRVTILTHFIYGNKLISAIGALSLTVMMIGMHINAAAQSKKGKKEQPEKVHIFNYVIDDPLDVYGRQPAPAITDKTVLLPEFCAYAGQLKDTIYRYEFYNAAHELIYADTLKDHKQLRFVSLLEGYTDHQHTYKDAAGKIQPLPVSRIIQRYDRISDDSWLHVNYKLNKTLRMQEYVNEIVKTDTVRSTDGSTTFRRYYRVTEKQ